MRVSSRGKCISELVAAILLVLIVVSVGSFIVYELMKRSSYSKQVFMSQLLKAKELAEEAPFNIVYTIYNATSGELIILLNVGSGQLTITGIYVNNTLVNTPNSTVIVNGAIIPNPEKISVKEMDVNVIIVENKLPITSGNIIVKVVSDAGTSATATGVVVS